MLLLMTLNSFVLFSVTGTELFNWTYIWGGGVEGGGGGGKFWSDSVQTIDVLVSNVGYNEGQDSAQNALWDFYMQ